MAEQKKTSLMSILRKRSTIFNYDDWYFAIPAMAGSADFERFLRNGICAAIVIFQCAVLKKMVISLNV